MKEKSIIFNTRDVRAILNTKPGTWPVEPIDKDKPYKWQTRKAVKPQPIEFIGWTGSAGEEPCGEAIFEDGKTQYPRYRSGDIFRVREAWLKVPWFYEAGGVESVKYFYQADGEVDEQHDLDSRYDKWHSSIHMPPEASRILLEVKGVGVERLQDITVADVNAEGVYMETPLMAQFPNGFEQWTEQRRQDWYEATARHEYIKSIEWAHDYIDKFIAMWDSINAKRGYSWESNPWVWVYEFMRVK